MPASERLPLFPLGLVLFPREVLPLHIFEERYKDLVRYCLAASSPFGIVAVTDDRIAEVGCTARIRTVLREYDDGTMDIETVGEHRCSIDATYDDLSYMTADSTMLTDRDETIPAADRERLVAQHMKLMELSGEPIRPSAYADEHLLSFRIGASAGLDLAGRQRLLELGGETERIAYLVQHLQEFIPRLQSATERKDRIRSNGHFN